jgi:hypothetical protein
MGGGCRGAAGSGSHYGRHPWLATVPFPQPHASIADNLPHAIVVIVAISVASSDDAGAAATDAAASQATTKEGSFSGYVVTGTRTVTCRVANWAAAVTIVSMPEPRLSRTVT